MFMNLGHPCEQAGRLAGRSKLMHFLQPVKVNCFGGLCIILPLSFVFPLRTRDSNFMFMDKAKGTYKDFIWFGMPFDKQVGAKCCRN